MYVSEIFFKVVMFSIVAKGVTVSKHVCVIYSVGQNIVIFTKKHLCSDSLQAAGAAERVVYSAGHAQQDCSFFLY